MRSSERSRPSALGVSYEVRELDVDRRRAVVERFDGDWYTQPKKETETFIEGTLQTREAAGVELSFGTVSVTEQVIAFQRKRMVDHEVMDTVALELPEQNFLTQALWYVIPRRLAGALPTEILLGSPAYHRELIARQLLDLDAASPVLTSARPGSREG